MLVFLAGCWGLGLVNADRSADYGRDSWACDDQVDDTLGKVSADKEYDRLEALARKKVWDDCMRYKGWQRLPLTDG